MVTVLTNQDFNRNQIQNVVIHPLATDPTAGNSAVGMLIYNTASNKLKVCSNAGTPTWEPLPTTHADVIGLINGGATKINSANLNVGTGASDVAAGNHTHSTYVVANGGITGATKCKITYDSKGLVTSGADLSLSDLPTIDPTKGGTGQTTCAKGDLFIGTGVNTVGKLTVGTNGYILTADSTQATGCKWAAAPTSDHNSLTGLQGGTSAEYYHLTASAYSGLHTHSNKSYIDTVNQNMGTAHSPSHVALTLTQATGTAPMTISSTTVVTNLNADLLDGKEASAFALASHNQSATTITSGTLGVARGGTGLSTFALGTIPYASALDTLSALTGPTGANKVLRSSAANTFAWGSLVATDIPTLTLSKISDAGTAAACNTGTGSGNVPVLDAGGKLNTSVLPSLALTTVSVVASEVAQLALTAQAGDVAVRSDENKSYIHNGGVAGTMADWTLLATPTDLVTSVAGRTGAVTLTASDVGLGNVTNESKATMFTNAALTGNPTAPTPTTGDNDTSIATTAFVHAQIDSDLAASGMTKKYSATVGDGTNTVLTVTHSLGVTGVICQVYRVASPYDLVICDVKIVDTNSLTLTFATAPTSGQFRVVVIG